LELSWNHQGRGKAWGVEKEDCSKELNTRHAAYMTPEKGGENDTGGLLKGKWIVGRASTASSVMEEAVVKGCGYRDKGYRSGRRALA